MARKRKDSGLLDIALQSPWPVSATLSALTLVGGFLVLPRVLAGSLLSPLADSLRPIIYAVAAVFGVVAVFKLVAQTARGNRQDDASSIRGAVEPSETQTAPPKIREFRNRVATEGYQSPLAPAVSPQRPTEWSIEVLQQIEWKGFEDLCVAFYRAKGIRAESTPLGPDGGVDVRLYQDDADPARCTAIVQCKAWGERLVGVKPVRELRGVLAHEGVEKAFFMAPGGYTEEAKAFAQENRITLLDGKLFFAMLKRLPPESAEALLVAATEGDWMTPSCPRCGTKMKARESKGGAFWGCAQYPKCRQTMPMKAKGKT